MIDITESTDEPTVRRWQRGYEIPVDITSEVRTDANQVSRTVWMYRRCVVAALTTVDIQAAIDRDFDGDVLLYQEAIDTARSVVLTPLV